MDDEKCRCGHTRDEHWRGTGNCTVSTEDVVWACGCSEFEPPTDWNKVYEGWEETERRSMFVPFQRQGVELPGGIWLEAIEHLAAAQALMEQMTLPFPRELEMGNLAQPHARSLAAMVEAIRQHYLATLRARERTPVRIVIDGDGVHVVADDG